MRVRSNHIACAAMIGLMGAPSVAAEPKPKPLEGYVPTGSNIREAPKAVTGEERGRTMTMFANCAAQRASPRVDHYLRHSDTLTIDPVLGDISEFLPLNDCLGSASGFDVLETQAKFKNQNLRSLLLEAAYLRANKSFQPLAADAQPAPARQYFSVEASLKTATGIGAFSDCVVAKNPSAADAILRTDRESAAERTAARVLAPALGACLVAGTTMTFSPTAIRTYAAEGLWQRYEAGKPPTFKGRK